MENALTLVSVRDGEVYANSRDVAREFEKRPDHVLRDIDKILRDINSLDMPPNLGASSWFVETTYEDEYGRTKRSVDMTQQGFTYLTTSYTGTKAAEFKVKYILAFDEMKRRLQNLAVPPGPAQIELGQIRLVVREELEPVHRELRLVKSDMSDFRERLEAVVPRRPFNTDTMKQYRFVVKERYSCKCPACWREKIVAEDGSALPGLNYDHHKGREKNGPEDGWAVCIKCNLELRKDDFRRDKSQDFVVFQKYRRQLFAKQKELPSPPKQLGLLF